MLPVRRPLDPRGPRRLGPRRRDTARMTLLNDALRAGLSPARPRRGQIAGRALLLVGGGGALGAEVLHQLLASRRFARVGVLVEAPLGTALPGLVPVTAGDDAALAGHDTAMLVFGPDRHANGRELAFVRPLPAELPALAARLATAGVRRLVIVTPHAPSSLPESLKRGLADLDEQSVTALGFDHLLFMRPAQSATPGSADRSPGGRGNLGQRIAGWALSQLTMMIPQREQPVRIARIAQLAVQLAWRLADAPAGTRVVPPELVWQAAQTSDVGALAEDWLAGRATPLAPAATGRL